MIETIKQLATNGELTPYILTLLGFLKVATKDILVDTIKEKIKNFFSKNQNSSSIEDLIKELKKIDELENITSHNISNAFNQTFNNISNSSITQNINSNNNIFINSPSKNNPPSCVAFSNCENNDNCTAIIPDKDSAGFYDCKNTFNSKVLVLSGDTSKIFEETKNLIIDFFSKYLNLLDDILIQSNYTIGYIGIDGDPSSVIGNSNCIVWEVTKIEIASENKISQRLLSKIINIILEMPNNIFTVYAIKSKEDIYLHEHEGQGRLMKKKILKKIDAESYETLDSNKIIICIEEIKNGDWDDYIRTAIKELG